MKQNKALLTASMAVLLGATSMANAGTVETKTYVDTIVTPNATQVNFDLFDVNGDGQFSMSEVGEKLFYLFDRDGNKLIDNIEWDHKGVFTVLPTEKETYTFVDYNDDGEVDATSYTFETFYAQSGLARFDNDKDGLSPRDFTEQAINQVDDNDDATVDLQEWQEVYTATKMVHEQPETYNK